MSFTRPKRTGTDSSIVSTASNATTATIDSVSAKRTSSGSADFSSFATSKPIDIGKAKPSTGSDPNTLRYSKTAPTSHPTSTPTSHPAGYKPRSPSDLTRISTTQQRYKESRESHAYAQCGRHSNEWLFGNFSFTGTFKGVLKRTDSNESR